MIIPGSCSHLAHIYIYILNNLPEPRIEVARRLLTQDMTTMVSVTLCNIA